MTSFTRSTSSNRGCIVDLLAAAEALGPVAHSQDQHLVCDIELSAGQVGDDAQHQAGLAGSAGAHDVDALGRLVRDQGVHQDDVGAGVFPLLPVVCRFGEANQWRGA